MVTEEPAVEQEQPRLNPAPEPGLSLMPRQTDLICTPQRRAPTMPQATQAAQARFFCYCLLWQVRGSPGAERCPAVSLFFPRRRLFRCRPARSLRGNGRPG